MMPVPAWRPRGWLLAYLSLFTSFRTGRSANVHFTDCLDTQGLHFVPSRVDAVFDTQNESYPLKTTVYGDVRGGVIQPAYGSNDELLTTMISKLNVLQYTPVEQRYSFCNQTVGRKCPLSNSSAFAISNDLNSSYSFTTLSASFVVYGDASTRIACITADITPDFGSKIASLLAYIPLVILILSGAATIFAGIFCPWGTSDIFRWTSNYGRDPDLLRLVTPGFGDCLHYIQFVVLTGSLSLNYPGFYQPAVSQASWSILMFNQSFVSHSDGYQSLRDGVYAVNVNGTYGMDRMRQYVGLGNVDDVWAGMIIWLLVILAAVLFLTQVGFMIRWIYRKVTATPEEDLRAKNVPFSVGNAIRIVFNYFLLPIVALSMFQFVEAANSPAYVTAMAALLLVLLIGFSSWVLRVVVKTRPRSHLFDDLPTVLLYGPLYNTYSDSSAAFALIPVFLTFVRGIAIGAVQPSGVAQVVLLAICEVVLILTLITFKPFHSPTSMNVYHTFFSIIRLITTLLSIVFVPSLKVAESSKGWVGYVILLMHAIALVFGFFLNSIQTFVEVAVRLAGAGGDGTNTTRGGLVKVFGKRQLSRRTTQRTTGRQSALSGNGTLNSDQGRKSSQLNGRTRSMSGSSAKLLDGGASNGRASVGLDNMSAGGTNHRRAGSSHSPFTPSTPGGASTFSQFPASQGGGIVGIKPTETGTPYYRPPRARRQTGENYSPAAKTRTSWASGDWMAGNMRTLRRDSERTTPMDATEAGALGSGRNTPAPPFATSQQFPSDPNVNEQNRPDYAVREVDFYYRVRGPALNTAQTRRLGTGPADPTGPVASATGWIKGLFGGKTKDKGKGFEVVRSSRMPPTMMAPKTSEENAVHADEIGVAQTRDLDLEGQGQMYTPDDGEVSPIEDEDDEVGAAAHERDISSDEEDDRHHQSHLGPTLPGIDAGGAIELPSRVGSRASSSRRALDNANPPPAQRGYVPGVPRKSSKRKPSHSPAGSDKNRLPPISGTPPRTPTKNNNNTPPRHHLHPSISSSATTTTAAHMPFSSHTSSTGDTRHLADAEDLDDSLVAPGTAVGNYGEGPSAPANVGYVHQYRASDNIHRMNSAERREVQREGSSAELVEDPRMPHRQSVSASSKREPIE